MTQDEEVQVPRVTFHATSHLTVDGSWFATLSGPLMQSAAFFARRAFEEENKGTKASQQDLVARRSNVLGGIVLACTALEAFANELFIETIDLGSPMDVFDGEAVATIKYAWKYLEKESALDKIQRALGLAKRPLLETGDHLYQSSKLVFDLRNAIVHFKARTHGAAAPANHSHEKLEGKLRGAFAPNTLDVPVGTSLFPYGCMSHSCVKWAVDAQLELLEEFAQRLDIPGVRNRGWYVATR